MTEPKNAITKQYKKLFEMDHVELEFEEDAVRAIAGKSVERKTGARGLRAIMEDTMMDTMFEIPSESLVRKCIITKDSVEGKAKPILEFADEEEVRKVNAAKTVRLKDDDEIA